MAGLTAVVGPAAPVGAATLSFSPKADAQVSAASPSTNYGRAKTLGVGTTPQVESYLRFDVRNVTESVSQARLRVFVANGGGTVEGPAVHTVSGKWAENKVTWASRPARTSTVPLFDAGSLTAGTWVEFDVTAAVAGNGTVAFGLVGTSSDAATFASREEKKAKPVLIVATAPAPDTTPPDTTIPASSGPSGTTTSTGASFAFSANETGARFECLLDTAAFAACTSPKAYSGLALGDHTFAVRAIDVAGNVDASPATRTWRIVEAGAIRNALLAPATGAWWGAHHKISASLSDDGKKQALTDFEALVGRKLGIDMYYEPWGNSFPTFRESWDMANGRIPMISWGKTETTDITKGMHDAYIRDRANAIEALGQPVFIRWFWEMDGTRNADVAVSPAAYIAAWKYLRSMFAAEGATNVAWVWCPNASGFEDGSAQSFYPGDDHVDWVCADGYNWYPSDNRAYQGFEEKFQAFHDFAVAHNKPAVAGEYGSQEMEPGRRAQWLRDAADAVRHRLTNMLAVVYFHSYSSDYDWQFYDEPDALDAFADMGALPYFNP
ncbi:MAG: DUF7594 domain-containing protein [Acidimicrobiia bacterium]